jgi:peptide/nickel transport system permease protein
MRLSRFTPRFYIAGSIFVLIALFGFVGPLIFSSRKANHVIGGLYDHPSGKAWLGTDNLGHDVFTNLMYGTRTSLIVGLIAGAAAVLVGVVLGTLAGYIGGVVEEALMALTNVILAIPQFVVLILISIALHTRSATGVALVIACTAWPWTTRAVRAQASSVRTREHLDIARLSGAGTFSVIVYDVVPYMLSYICMAFVLQVSGAIQAEAALSLLGLGPSNGVSLGIMLNWALAWESVRSGAWWAFVPPTVLLAFIVFALLMLQSSLDELFNPRLQRPVRRRWRRGLLARSAAAVRTPAPRRPTDRAEPAEPPAAVPKGSGAVVDVGQSDAGSVGVGSEPR